jgi:hypothetical protein
MLRLPNARRLWTMLRGSERNALTTTVIVEYNVCHAGETQSKARKLVLPENLGHIVPDQSPVPPVLSLRSWPLGRLEAAFGEEPTDEELCAALERGWDTYLREGMEDRDRMARALSAFPW